MNKSLNDTAKRLRGAGRWYWLALIGLALLLPLTVAIGYYAQTRSSHSSTATGPLAEGYPFTAAVQEFERAIELEPANVEGYRYLSGVFQMAGRLEDAAAVWERAAEANPGQSWPLVELGNLYNAEGFPIKARETFYRAAAANPQDTGANQYLARSAANVTRLQAARSFLLEREPTATAETVDSELVMVNQALPNGWTFVGYYAVPGDLSAPESGKIWHFWQSPSAEVMPSLHAGTWEPVASTIWARQDAAQNIFENGSFEEGATSTGPRGFPTDLYGAAPATRQLRLMQRAGETTTVAALVNDAANSNTSLVSRWRSIQPDMAYVVSSEVYNESGNPAVGWRWSGSIDEEYAPFDRYASPVAAEEGWQHYAALATPLPGASSLQLWLLNTNTSGSAFMDDVAAVPVPLPAPVWPNARSAQDELSEQWRSELDAYLRFPAVVDDPSWQSKIAGMDPMVRIGQPLSSGWTLQGYSADETLLAQGRETPLFVFWEGPVGVSPGTRVDGWIDLQGGRWLQVLPSVQNQVVNGAFEEGLVPWDIDMFSAPQETHQLTVTVRSDFSTTVGILNNTVEISVTGASGPPIPVLPNHLYLQSGWMRGETGRGYIGNQWQGNIPEALMPFDRYIAGAQSVGGWRRFAGVSEPLQGATSTQVWLLNYLGQGPVYFDDIVFVPVPAPSTIVTNTLSTPTQTAGDPAQALAYLTEYQDNPDVLNDEVWLSGVATTGPALVLNQPAAGDWTFVGMSADEEALAAGAVTTVFYFWRGPVDAVAGTPEDGWYSIDAGTWLQIEDGTQNLVPNANFELPPADAADAGFPIDYLTSESAADRVQLADRNGSSTSVAVLASDVTSGTVGIASVPLPADGQHWYLQSGWIRALDGANGTLGISWTDGEGLDAVQTTRITAENVVSTAWDQYSRLHPPLPGAGGIQVFAYNYLAPGVAQFDDLLLLPVQPPGPLAPAVGSGPDSRPRLAALALP